MSSTGAPHQSTRIPALGPRGEGWVALQFVLLGGIAIGGWLFGGASAGMVLVALVVVGGLFIIGGLALAYLGVRDLDSSLSPLPRPTDRAVLISRGVYGRLRHPIYAGLVLAAVGWSLLTGSLIALALSAALAVALDLKSRREEVWLYERYPDYSAYAARTRRFVPGIY